MKNRCLAAFAVVVLASTSVAGNKKLRKIGPNRYRLVLCQGETWSRGFTHETRLKNVKSSRPGVAGARGTNDPGKLTIKGRKVGVTVVTFVARVSTFPRKNLSKGQKITIQVKVIRCADKKKKRDGIDVPNAGNGGKGKRPGAVDPRRPSGPDVPTIDPRKRAARIRAELRRLELRRTLLEVELQRLGYPYRLPRAPTCPECKRRVSRGAPRIGAQQR